MTGRKKIATHVSGAALQSMVDSERIDALAAIANRMSGSWQRANNVFIPVRAVPTIFPWFDLETRVGGLPTERVLLVHGPSNEGKTLFVVGLCLSFLRRGHFAAFVDAEQSTPSTWLKKLMGDYFDSPAFMAMLPESYEQTVDAVRTFCGRIGDAKKEKQIPEDTSGIVIIDSIRKLTPKKLMDNLFEGGAEKVKGKGRFAKSKGIDGYGGRAAQYKAALNSQWMDDLVPMLRKTGTVVVIITREVEDPDAGMFDFEDFIVQGGKSLFYESGLCVRVVLSKDLKDEGKNLIGQRHSLIIRKTKVAQKETKHPTAYFHSSTGIESPEGFDLARDVLGLAVETGIVEVRGGGYVWDKKRLGSGESGALTRLREDAELLSNLEQKLRSNFVKEITR